MKTLHLHRFAKVEDGILGRTSSGLYTMENDAYNVPEGEYTAKLDFYHTGGYKTYEILVPGRSRILFHKGNTEDDSRGCILLGTSLDVVDGKIAVSNSREGFGQFMLDMAGTEEFTLVITAQ